MMQQYTEFVLARVSPPRNIDNVELHILHAALGIATEALELLIADTNKDTINEKEELGDILFYLVFMASSIAVEPETLPLLSAFPDSPTSLQESMEELVSFTKKVIIYNQDKYPELRTTFLAAWNAFLIDVDKRGYSIPTLINANMEKLAKRYKEKFTVEESINRADKANEQPK